MKKKLLAFLLSGVWSCASIAISLDTATSEYADTATNSSARNNGKAIANMLTNSYENIVENCGEGKPAYLCSGVTIRGTSPKLDRFALDPSPGSVQSGGVSFSWLRQDAKFWKLSFNYGNGFIVFNKFNSPVEVDNHLEYLCFYPEDAGTGSRANKGCGESSTFPKESGPCQPQGIYTADQWLEHFKQAPAGSNKYQYQCGFIITEQGQYDGAGAFRQGLLANKLLHGNDLSEQNEIRIATWSTSQQGYPERFPVQAFFYINSNVEAAASSETITPGINGARYDQFYFYQRTGIWVPVIRITLPKTVSEDVKFEFLPSDQRVLESVNLIPVITGLLDCKRRWNQTVIDCAV